MIQAKFVYFGDALDLPVQALVEEFAINVQILPASEIAGIAFQSWVLSTHYDAYLVHRFLAEHDLGRLPNEPVTRAWHGKTIVVAPWQPKGFTYTVSEYQVYWAETIEHMKSYKTIGISLTQIMLQPNPKDVADDPKVYDALGVSREQMKLKRERAYRMYLNSFNGFLLALRDVSQQCA